MSTSNPEQKEYNSMEAQILEDIRNSEKRAQEILEKANAEKERILHEASSAASGLISSMGEEVRKDQEKKIAEFRDAARHIREDKIAEGKKNIKQLKSKSEKNVGKAAEYILGKFEEMM